jgi:Cof subfamily protein (haloacid dehalogenase superfamily)
MPIQLLAIDLDDTLLSHDLSISQENKAAIAKAEDLGVRVILASGRSLFSMKRYIQELKLDQRHGYVISWNGSQVTDAQTGDILIQHKMEPGLTELILNWALENHHTLQTQYRDEMWVMNSNHYSNLDLKLSGMKLIEPTREEFLALNHPKLIVPGEPEQLVGIEAELEELFGDKVRMFRSKPYFLEIMPPEADKGFALAELAQLLSIPRESVMAVGDSGNDKEMIRFAGLGVAMYNALPEIQAIADWVTTKDHNNHGLAEAIDRWVLSQPILSP